uniref:Uncharacterized protein n=1 Tax=Meloidogyne enterolobii TaxID=390850 RepID=A0A6V7TQ08_MELEN|nr:unnamed protein product [Meloidogyne enterolobii]
MPSSNRGKRGRRKSDHFLFATIKTCYKQDNKTLKKKHVKERKSHQNKSAEKAPFSSVVPHFALF